MCWKQNYLKDGLGKDCRKFKTWHTKSNLALNLAGFKMNRDNRTQGTWFSNRILESTFIMLIRSFFILLSVVYRKGFLVDHHGCMSAGITYTIKMFSSVWSLWRIHILSSDYPWFITSTYSYETFLSNNLNLYLYTLFLFCLPKIT